MIKRLFLIAVFTGISQVAVLFFLKYISQHAPLSELNAIAQIDSLTNLIVTLLSLGLITAVVRDVSLEKNWKEPVQHAQSGRLLASLLILPVAIMGFWKMPYLLFLFAPAFAINSDYVLYGRSQPVTAAFVSMLRVLFPYLLMISLFLFQSFVSPLIFLISTGICYGLAGVYIAMHLRLPLIPKLNYKDLWLFVKTLPLGVVNFSYYFIGLGLIVLAGFFYSPAITGIAFLGVKFYSIYKGVLRMINQSFIRELQTDAACLKVDLIGGFAGILFLGLSIFFRNTLTNTFLGDKFVSYSNSLPWLAAAGFCQGLFISYTTRAVLLKQDRQYALLVLIALIGISMLTIIGSFLMQGLTPIYGAILLGESICVGGLIVLRKNSLHFRQHLIIFLQLIPYIAIIAGVRYFLSDGIAGSIVAIGSCGLTFLLLNYRKLRISQLTAESVTEKSI